MRSIEQPDELASSLGIIATVLRWPGTPIRRRGQGFLVAWEIRPASDGTAGLPLWPVNCDGERRKIAPKRLKTSSERRIAGFKAL